LTRYVIGCESSDNGYKYNHNSHVSNYYSIKTYMHRW